MLLKSKFEVIRVSELAVRDADVSNEMLWMC